MNFFLLVHRSIFDPGLYSEVPALGRRVIAPYLFKLVLAAIFISSVAQTGYFLAKSKDIAPVIANAMKGISLKDGRLQSARPLPYEVPLGDISLVYNKLLNQSIAVDTPLVPRVIVDTASSAVPPSIPSIIMRSTDMQYHFMPNKPWAIAYGRKGGASGNFEFTESAVSAAMKKEALTFFILMLFLNGLRGCGLILFSIFLLSLAAYIFRIDRSRTLSYFIGLAGFAVTPIPIGMVLIALANVTVRGVWQILVIVTVFIMLRALFAISKNAANPDGGGS